MTQQSFLHRFLRKEELFLEHHLPHLFYVSQCRMPVWLYILFRFLLAVVTVHSFVLAMVFVDLKFPIFFTNWTYTVQTVTMVYKFFVVVFYAWLTDCKQIDQSDYDPSDYPTLLWHLKIQWILHNVTSTIPLIVTVVFWTMLYGSMGPLPPLDAYINAELHAVNGVIAILDCFVTAIPFRVYHFIHAAIYGTIYVLFSVVYHLCGGTGINGERYIYFFLDWGEKPGATFAIIVGLLLAGMLIHFLMAYLKHAQQVRNAGPCGAFCGHSTNNYTNNVLRARSSKQLVDGNPYQSPGSHNVGYQNEDV